MANAEPWYPVNDVVCFLIGRLIVAHAHMETSLDYAIQRSKRAPTDNSLDPQAFVEAMHAFFEHDPGERKKPARWKTALITLGATEDEQRHADRIISKLAELSRIRNLVAHSLISVTRDGTEPAVATCYVSSVDHEWKRKSGKAYRRRSIVQLSASDLELAITELDAWHGKARTLAFKVIARLIEQREVS